MKFTDYPLKDYLYQALQAIHFDSQTNVQELALPKAFLGESILVQSATGSGKTHTFLLPILQNLDENLEEVQAVILSPTRELAMQLYDVLMKLIEFSPVQITVAKAIGGIDRENEIRRFTKTQPQIIIGTIGRLNDLVIESNVLKIHNAKMIVIDEADMIFEEKELLEVDKIMGKVQGTPQFMIFSATISISLKHFLKKYLDKLDVITLNEKEFSTKNIHHVMIPCKAKDKKEVLVEILKYLNPYLVLIFCNTKESVEELAMYLAERGYKIGKLHGDLPDRIRKQTIKRINSLEYKYVVASDIASRGIDIEGVSHVINYELPKNIEFYVHRTGRTGRFDKTGDAYSLYAYEDDSYIKKLQEKGLIVETMKIKNNDLVKTKAPKRQITKIKSYEEELHQKIRLPKKVKPGYKKKRKEQINTMVKKARRSRVEEIYRRKSKNNENR